MWTSVQTTELKKSWVSNAEKMEFVLEVRVKIKVLVYTQYVFNVYSKLCYNPLCGSSLGQATSISQAECKKTGTFHNCLLEMHARDGSTPFKNSVTMRECEKVVAGMDLEEDLLLSKYAGIRDYLCGVQKMARKKIQIKITKISRLQRLSLHRVARAAFHLEGKTSCTSLIKLSPNFLIP